MGKQIDILVSCLNSILCGNFNNIIDEDNVKFARDFPKDILKVLTGKVEKSLLNDDNVKSFYENFVKYFLTFRKKSLFIMLDTKS